VRHLLIVCACVVVAGVVVALVAAPGKLIERHAGVPGWLGLNGNSSRYLGPLDAFSRHGVVYDRNLELTAGDLPGEPRPGTAAGELGLRLKSDHELGMTPVVVIEYRGYGRAGYEFRPDPEFPGAPGSSAAEASGTSVSAYVTGFVRSADAILKLVGERYPGMHVLFEAMNEPWGYTTPQYEGAQYAHVIAQLLPAASAAGIPAQDIYVGATGKGCEVGGGCVANGWVQAMYKAEPALRDQVEGWYLHPYGPPSGLLEYDNGGIQSLPLVRGAIASGRDNVIVSEVGFCADDVNNPRSIPGGVDCHGTAATNGASAASLLGAMLAQAEIYHHEGWLKALIVYSRNDGGWAMQVNGGALTPSGRALLAFADSSGSP
jgi:hypothetical protein